MDTVIHSAGMNTLAREVNCVKNVFACLVDLGSTLKVDPRFFNKADSKALFGKKKNEGKST